MATLVKHFTFGTGTGTGDLTAITGLGGAPKAVVFYVTGFTNECNPSFGVATSATERFCANATAESGAATTLTTRLFRDDSVACIIGQPSAGIVGGVLDVASFDADGFTPTVDAAFEGDTTIHGFMLGGDVASAKAGSFVMQSATGQQVISGLGAALGGAPTGLILFGSGVAVQSPVDDPVKQAKLCVGFTDGTNQGCIALVSQDGQAAGASGSVCATDALWLACANDHTSVADSVAIVSLDADGFTYNKTVGSAQFPLGYLAWRGGSVVVGSTTARTDTANQVVSGLGIDPLLVMLMHAGGATASQSTPTDDVTFAIGAGTGAAARSAVWVGDDNGADPTDAGRVSNTARILAVHNPAGAGAPWDMDLASMGTGEFTLDQVTAAASAFLIPFMVIGSDAGGGGGFTGRKDSIHKPSHEQISHYGSPMVRF